MRPSSAWPGQVIVSVSLVGWLVVTPDAAGELYQCRTQDGSIYTDTPAQLSQCTPLDHQGGTSPLGLVGGPSVGSPPPSTSVPASPPPPPENPSTPTALPTPPLPAAPSPDTTATPAPCAPALNPWNPLTAPPCPSAEKTAPSPVAGTQDTGIGPPTSGQP